MPRIGLTKDLVVKAAAALIEQHGAENFSMRLLAESLNIKTASLYNHVESMDALLLDVCTYALNMQREAELAAIGSKTRQDAIIALADAYRQFARQHLHLYRLILRFAPSNYTKLAEPSRCVIGPFLQVLKDYDLSQEETYHWQRILRGVIHGFFSQEDAGFFSHLPVDVDVSFRMAVECCITGLEQAERRNQNV